MDGLEGEQNLGRDRRHLGRQAPDSGKQTLRRDHAGVRGWTRRSRRSQRVQGARA